MEEVRDFEAEKWGGCLVGDFNEMLPISEKDGMRPIAHIRINLFRDLLNSIDLMDLKLKVSKYTWISNPIDGIITKQMIDMLTGDGGIFINML